MGKRLLISFSPLLFLLSIFLVNFQNDRTEFAFIAVFYTIAFLTYLVLYSTRNTMGFKQLMFIAISAQLLSLWNLPNLSIDFYRFLWDGEVTLAGINPFDYRPEEIVASPELHAKIIGSRAYMQDVYDGIGSQSQGNFSCYPPINQFYFIAATAFSDSLILNTFLLKLLIISTEFLGAFYLIKLLKNLKIEPSRIWLLFLNPLWIIECTGNTHFEGVMLSFLFIAFYFLSKKKELMGSLFFAVAVQVKLIPLLILPFFYRYLGWKKAFVFYASTIFIVIAFGLIQLNSENIYNFADSLRQYFQVFEFNSLVLYQYIQYGIWKTGWNMTKTYSPQLSLIAMYFIFTLALWGDIQNWNKLMRRISIAFFIYLLFSSTMHPWYILPLLAFSLFTNYRFPVVWSFFIFFSYIFYHYENSSAFAVRLINFIEYGVVLGWFGWELMRSKGRTVLI